MIRFSLLFLFFCLAQPAYSQPVFFEKIFGSPGSDFSRSVKQLPDGTIFLGGFSDAGPNGGYDISLSRLDRYGNLQWTKYYGDAFDNNGLYMNKCSDGSLVITGEQQSASNGLDVFVYKIDTAGSIVWQNTYSTPVNESCKYIEQTADGGFVLCGFQNDQYSSNNIYVLKIDSVGGVQWDQSFGGTDNDYSDMIRQLPNGNYILTADTRSMGAGGYDVYLLLLDTAGNVIWDYTYGDQFQNGCQGVLVTSQGKFLNYGETEIYQNSAFDFFVELVDTNGSSMGRKTFGGSFADAAFSAVETPDGGFMLTGYSNSYFASPAPISVVVLKTDSAGNFQWARQYGGEGIDIGYDIVPSIDNGYLVTGKTFANNNDEYYLLHLDQAGYTDISPVQPPAQGFSIYPNPSAESITIRLDEPQNNSSIRIMETSGKTVYSGPLAAPSQQLNLSVLIPGIYIVEVTSGTHFGHQRLIITNR